MMMKQMVDRQLEKEQEAHPEIILRDFLAIDRTRLANQRTLLSFLRTGLYLFVTALAVWKVDFLEDLAFLTGILIGLGAITMLVGVINYFTMRKKIARHYQVSPKAKGELMKE
ncbi:MAG TPA: hypothetical protein DCE41_18445 [Cytophagales bacterium]|nr:hypothetical protein [Cytophagales bacterium]HAA19493.1 hypothetical protein [Cytophagales bacterium]HAP59633.1 hypothetical protein [Cytophagales bacterium]